MNWKRIFKIVGFTVLWLLFLGTLVTVFVAATQKSKTLACTGYRINIDHEKGVSFVDTNDIKKALKEVGFESFQNKKIELVNVNKIEKHLEKNSFIQNAELFITRNGIVNININQKKPLLRVFNSDGVSFYLGEENDVIPWSPKFSAHVPVLLGLKAGALDYYSKNDTALVKKICEFARYVEGDPFWNAQIDQIIIDADRQIKIIPTLGDNTILLGDLSNYQEKLDNMILFYKKNIKNKNILNKYETISLAYKDQIVCKNKIIINHEPTDSTSTAQ